VSEEEAKQETSIACCLFHAGLCLAYSLTMKMVATCSSEMSVDFQRYIAEDNHRCENLRSYTVTFMGKKYF
jgi:hypothetical protein